MFTSLSTRIRFAAVSLVVLVFQGGPARGDLAFNIIATPASQSVTEGAGGTIKFDIFNQDTVTAYVNFKSFLLQNQQSIGSIDSTDDITLGTPTVTAATNGTLIAGTGIYTLGTTLATNLLEISVTFTTDKDTGETDGDSGTNLVPPTFNASETISGTGANPVLSNPTAFSFNAGNVTTQATVIVNDPVTPEPATLLMVATAIPPCLVVYLRRRRKLRLGR